LNYTIFCKRGGENYKIRELENEEMRKLAKG